jgi:hypothetical protein
MVLSNSAPSSSSAPPLQQKVTQYRVDVREGMLGGHLIRAGFNGHEWLVRVPMDSKPGDSFIFSMSDADHAAYLASKNDPDAVPYTNETAFVERPVPTPALAKVARSLSLTWLLSDLLVDAQRIVFLGSIFVLAFIGGLVMGTLSYTETYITNE